MLWLLNEAANSEIIYVDKGRELRLFAVWCARHSLGNISGTDPAISILDATEEFLNQEIDSNALARVRAKLGATAASAGAVGLPRHSESATAFLACYHASDEPAIQAAWHASRLQARATADLALRLAAKKLDWKGQLSTLIAEQYEVYAAVQDAAFASQADTLISIVGNPFASKSSKNRWPRTEAGLPCTVDIAMPEDLRRYAVSEQQKHKEGVKGVNPVKTKAILDVILRQYEELVRERGGHKAHQVLNAMVLSIYEAPDFDAELDLPTVEAYGIAEEILFADLLAKSKTVM